jgi:hypothetical protein
LAGTVSKSNAFDTASAPWGKVPRYIATMALSKEALRLFIVISSHADWENRVAFPGQDRLARELQWFQGDGQPNRRRVFRVLKELEAADLVKRAGTQSINGSAWVRRYLVARYPDAQISGASTPTNDAHHIDASDTQADAQISEHDAQISGTADAQISYARTDQHQTLRTDQRTLAASSSLRGSPADDDITPLIEWIERHNPQRKEATDAAP